MPAVATSRCGCETAAVHAAALCFDLHIPHSRSLKEKRSALRPVIDGLRNKYHVSAAETGAHDLRQRAELGVAAVSSHASHLEEIFATIERFVDAADGLEMISVERVWLEAEEVLGSEWT